MIHGNYIKLLINLVVNCYTQSRLGNLQINLQQLL